VTGLLLGLLAYALHGLVEAVGINARAGLVVWVLLGLLIAVGSTTDDPQEPCPPNTTALFRFPRTLVVALLLPVGLLVASPLALNAALVPLHGPAAAAASSSLLWADLELADRLAWGPFRARVWSAQALAAGASGDLAGELGWLRLAAPAAPWDPTLALRLSELELARGDSDGAVRALQIGGLVELPLSRGQASPPRSAIGWFTLAHRVDPTDWRPFLAAAVKLTEAGRGDKAAAMRQEALRLGGAQAYRSAVKEGLLDESVPLPAAPDMPPPKVGLDLFAEASDALAGT
jgi:hypothetical protein